MVVLMRNPGCWFLCSWWLMASVLAAAQGRLADQHGNIHDLSVPTGSYTIVDFAASWCVPCYRSLPQLQALSREYPEIRFLVVSVDDEVSGRDRLVSDLEITMPVLWDEDHALVEKFSPAEFPATYLLDPKGEIVAQFQGSGEPEWRRMVAELDRLNRTAKD